MKKYNAQLLAIIAVISILSGCSKADKSAAPKAAADAAVTTPAKSDAQPVSADLQALISSNRTAISYHQVFYVTNSAFPDVEKAHALLEMLPSFDIDGQRATAHAASRYVDDANHALISQLLIKGELNPLILSIFMTDTLKRSEGIKVPVLKALAEKPEHRMNNEAKELLAAFAKFQVSATNLPQNEKQAVN